MVEARTDIAGFRKRVEKLSMLMVNSADVKFISTPFCVDTGKLTEVSVAFCADIRSEEHTSELQSQSNLVCRLLLEKKDTFPGSNIRLVMEDDDRTPLCPADVH